MFGDAPRSVHEAYSYGNKDSKNMSTANNATLFLSCRPHQLPVHEPQVPPRPTAPLQRPKSSPYWRLGGRPVVPYNSRSTRLSLSSRPGAKRCNACCSRLISIAAAPEMWDLRCAFHQLV